MILLSLGPQIMLNFIRHIAVPCLLVLALTGCDRIQRQLQGPSDFSIQQITPETVRADEPTTLTITGAGFDEVEVVRFGFRKRNDEIATIDASGITKINNNTIEVLTPILPGIKENERVWVSVGDPLAEPSDTDVVLATVGLSSNGMSNAVDITFRPPNIIDLYGMYALMATGAFVAALIVLGFIRRGFRRIAFRRELLEAKGRRLALRDERRAKAVLAELAAEKEAAQLKLEAEFLPYADQATGSDSDE